LLENDPNWHQSWEVWTLVVLPTCLFLLVFRSVHYLLTFFYGRQRLRFHTPAMHTPMLPFLTLIWWLYKKSFTFLPSSLGNFLEITKYLSSRGIHLNFCYSSIVILSSCCQSWISIYPSFGSSSSSGEMDSKLIKCLLSCIAF
jgi:hypothetical protein